MTEKRGATATEKTWQLAELHGCWWAYEGELPPPEAFTTHGHARHILGPFPTRAMAEQQLPRQRALRARGITRMLYPGARDGDDRRAAAPRRRVPRPTRSAYSRLRARGKPPVLHFQKALDLDGGSSAPPVVRSTATTHTHRIAELERHPPRAKKPPA
jgi:hypothetical protein